MPDFRQYFHDISSTNQSWKKIKNAFKRARRELHNDTTEFFQRRILNILTKNNQNFAVFCRYLIKKKHMRKKSSWMKRLRVYRIRLQKNKFSKPSRSRSLRWACNRGWGWGWWWRSLDLFERRWYIRLMSVSGLTQDTDYPEGLRQYPLTVSWEEATDF